LSIEQANEELASLNLDVDTLRSDYQTLLALRTAVFNNPVGSFNRPSAAQNRQIAALLAKYNLPYNREIWERNVEVFMQRYGNVLR